MKTDGPAEEGHHGLLLRLKLAETLHRPEQYRLLSESLIQVFQGGLCL